MTNGIICKCSPDLFGFPGIMTAFHQKKPKFMEFMTFFFSFFRFFDIYFFSQPGRKKHFWGVRSMITGHELEKIRGLVASGATETSVSTKIWYCSGSKFFTYRTYVSRRVML